MGSMPRCWPMASSLTQFLKLHCWVTKSPSFMHSEKRWIWTWRLEEEEELKESEGYYNNKSPFSCLFVSSSSSSSSSRNSALNNNLIRIRFRADIYTALKGNLSPSCSTNWRRVHCPFPTLLTRTHPSHLGCMQNCSCCGWMTTFSRCSITATNNK